MAAIKTNLIRYCTGYNLRLNQSPYRYFNCYFGASGNIYLKTLSPTWKIFIIKFLITWITTLRGNSSSASLLIWIIRGPWMVAITDLSFLMLRPRLPHIKYCQWIQLGVSMRQAGDFGSHPSSYRCWSMPVWILYKSISISSKLLRCAASVKNRSKWKNCKNRSFKPFRYWSVFILVANRDIQVLQELSPLGLWSNLNFMTDLNIGFFGITSALTICSFRRHSIRV